MTQLANLEYTAATSEWYCSPDLSIPGLNSAFLFFSESPVSTMTPKFAKRFVFTALAASLALSIAGCDHNPNNGLAVQIDDDRVSMPIPAAIRQIAALGDLNLAVQISVNGQIKREVPVSATQESISTVVSVPANQSNEIQVAWLAIVSGQKVLLADYSSTVVAGTTAHDLDVVLHSTVGPRFDADGDGRPNLLEAKEKRNMLSQFDLEVPFQTSFGGAFANVTSEGIDSDSSGDTVEQDATTTFSLRHDGTDLIVYVCGQDQTLQGDNLPTDGEYWHDDTVFIFLDGADSDNTAYDGIDDFQLAFIRSTGEMRVSKGGNNPLFCPGGSCVSHRFFSNSTACKYELTVNLPLADLNMTTGTAIGFDLEITDDDNGLKREGSSSWIGYEDMSNLNPSTFGTINLN